MTLCELSGGEISGGRGGPAGRGERAHEDRKGAGFLDGQIPSGFGVPMPSDDPALSEDEDPLDDELYQPLAPEPERSGGAS